MPPTPFDIHQLDPTNVFEREVLRAARGAGTAADDDYIDTLLTAEHPTETQHIAPGTAHAAVPAQVQHPDRVPDQQKQKSSADQVPAAESTDATGTADGVVTRTTIGTAQPAPPPPTQFARKRQNTHTPRQHP